MVRRRFQLLANVSTATFFTVAGTLSAITFAAQKYPTQQMSICLNNFEVSKPVGLYAIDPSTGQYTTYMPIWYVMQALEYLGIQSHWDAHNWNITLPSTLQPQFSTDASKYKPGTGNASIWVDNVLVQNAIKIVSKDPASGKDTTYVPIWYVGHVLETFGMDAQWDGQTHKWNVVWNSDQGQGSGGVTLPGLPTIPGLPTLPIPLPQPGQPILPGLPKLPLDGLTSTVDSVTSTVGSVTNTLGSATGTITSVLGQGK